MSRQPLRADWHSRFRLACAAALLLGGLPLAQSKLRVRPLLVDHLRRQAEPRGPTRPVHRFSRRLLDPLLQLAGVAMLAAAALELARALPQFV